MEQSRFFKWVWRLNGLFIFALLLFCIGWIIFFTFEAIRDYGQPYEPPVTAVQTTDTDEVLRLRLDRHRPSKEFVMFELEKEFPNITNIKGNPRMPVNLGIYQSSTEEMYWMFLGNKQIITDQLSLTLKAEAKDEPSELTGWLVSAFPDDNWQEKIKTVWIFSPDGKQQKTVLEGVRSNLEFFHLPDNKLMVIYKSGDTMTAIRIDKNNHSVSRAKAIQIPQ